MYPKEEPFQHFVEGLTDPLNNVALPRDDHALHERAELFSECVAGRLQAFLPPPGTTSFGNSALPSTPVGRTASHGARSRMSRRT